MGIHEELKQNLMTLDESLKKKKKKDNDDKHKDDITLSKILLYKEKNFKNNFMISNHKLKKKNNLRIRQLWQNANAVCFDVDSTICQNEAIDDFAKFLGVSNKVEKCTQDAMSGKITFREALKQRLDFMQPTQKQLNDFIAQHQIQLTPGIVDLIAELRLRNVDVFLVSGGFRPIIKPVAELLQVSFNRIFANEILFDQNGNYAGFDLNELTSNSGSKEVGKAGVCAFLKTNKNYKILIMIGDGTTDAEASPPADAFIGFGGNKVRDNVKKLSDWYVYDFKTLYNELFNL